MIPEGVNRTVYFFSFELTWEAMSQITKKSFDVIGQAFLVPENRESSEGLCSTTNQKTDQPVYLVPTSVPLF